jgi:hypothetical protein
VPRALKRGSEVRRHPAYPDLGLLQIGHVLHAAYSIQGQGAVRSRLCPHCSTGQLQRLPAAAA